MAYILYRHDGIVEKFDYNVETLKQIKAAFTGPKDSQGRFENICGKCGNCYAHKCDKVADLKKNIRNYDFVTRGVQYRDENGEAGLYIDKCENYIKDRSTKKIEVSVLNEAGVKQFRSISDIKTQSIDESVKMLSKKL